MGGRVDDAVLDERCDELVQEVLAPLVLGGSVRPVRPFGALLGLRLGVGRRISDGDLASRLDVARVRRARLLNGWDNIALTESYIDQIAAFKMADRARRPWAVPAKPE